MSEPDEPSNRSRGGPDSQNLFALLAAVLASASLIRLLLKWRGDGLHQAPPELTAQVDPDSVGLVDPDHVVPIDSEHKALPGPAAVVLVDPALQAANNAAPPPPPVPRRKPPLDTFSLALTLIVVIAGAVGFAYLRHTAETRLALVPIQDIGVYSIFRPADLTTGSAPKFRLMRVSGPEYRASVHSDADLLNHYTRAPLPAGKPIVRSLLQPVGSAADTVAVAVPATDALLLGGTVRPGDSVDLLVTPAGAGTPDAAHAGRPMPVAFTALTVLDVRRGGESIASPAAESATMPRTGNAVLVLALPSSRAAGFASLLPRASLLLCVHR